MGLKSYERIAADDEPLVVEALGEEAEGEPPLTPAALPDALPKTTVEAAPADEEEEGPFAATGAAICALLCETAGDINGTVGEEKLRLLCPRPLLLMLLLQTDNALRLARLNKDKILPLIGLLP